MTWPAVDALVLMFLGMLPRSPYFLLYLFFGLAPFGSLSMLGDTGGVNILPQSVCGVLLVCKLLLAKGQISRAFDTAIDPAKLGFLFAFLFYALFSAYGMPRFFAHMMEIVEMNPVNPGVSASAGDGQLHPVCLYDAVGWYRSSLRCLCRLG
jgi:hypothetical protein